MLQLAIFSTFIIMISPQVGRYIYLVFADKNTFLSKYLKPIECWVYRFCNIDSSKEQHWTHYAKSLMIFNLIGFLVLYFILRCQHYLPLNPREFAGLSPDLALNVAISFTTNTDWQSYTPEQSLSNFSQAFGLVVQQFLSAATSIAVAMAFIRGIAKENCKTIGNFYVDITKIILYILLPISFIGAIIFVFDGVPQTFSDFITANTVEGAKQLIAIGPVASQNSIELLGSNGGGFFNANFAHPYQNPTNLSNLLGITLIILLPAGLVFTYGFIINDKRQAWTIFIAMGILFTIGSLIIIIADSEALTINNIVKGNLEGKELRIGHVMSAIWSNLISSTSAGATNASLDSLMPLGGMIPMVNMMLGGLIFGGAGCGFYNMVVFIIITVFIAGLMVGRTPEYIGKKIEAKEIKLAMFSLLVTPIVMLGFCSLALLTPGVLSDLSNSGPHGFSEIIYAYLSAVNNNGSSFAGLNANNMYFNTTLSATMFVGRYLTIIPVLGIAGSFAAKKIIPANIGTFPTYGLQFTVLLVLTILIIGGLTYFPALTLGPIVEHLTMKKLILM
jgi:K+-transporting ATPase ATPase A chain